MYVVFITNQKPTVAVWEDILTQRHTHSNLKDAVKQSPRKWVYLFSEGNATMRDLLGGKGAGVSEMTNAGLPVPPGFTITTEACNAYYDAGKHFPKGMWEQALAALKIVEQQTGKGFGKKDNPLLVSVRSGAKFSMPGMMDTVLNLGINDETVQGLVVLTGDERFAYDAYRRFIQMFSKIVLGTDPKDFEQVLNHYKEQAGVKTDAEIPAADLKQMVVEFKQIAERQSGEPFPTHVYQLLLPRFDEHDKERAKKEGQYQAKGINASPGAAVGKAVFDAEHAEELGKAGTPVVLVRPETSPEDYSGMVASKGILTER